APIIAMTISATIRPYSTAVAPRESRSSFRKLRIENIGFPPRSADLWAQLWQHKPNQRLRRDVTMENFPTLVPVVAGMNSDSEGRILLQQALPGKRHAGLWELPGGKVDPGETPRAALVREISEE